MIFDASSLDPFPSHISDRIENKWVCLCVFLAFISTPTLNKDMALPDQLLPYQSYLSASSVPGF